jgi:signal transduction histidine kinase
MVWPPPRAVTRPPGGPDTPWHAASRGFWHLVNRPRSFDHQTVRIVSWTLLVCYGAIAVTRHRADHPEFLLLRLAICLYAIAGVVLAYRFDWRGLRVFTVGLALLLPLNSAYIDGTLGHRLSEVALTALATFAPLVFLQTGLDLLVVTVALVLGHGALLAVLPPPAVPLPTILLVVGAAIVTGAMAGLTLVVHRARMNAGTMWWQEACARERTLREFTELTACHTSSPDLLPKIAERFRETFAGGRCAIVLADAPGGPFAVAATAGFAPERAETLTRAPLPDDLTLLLWRVVERRAPIVRERLDEAQRRDIEQRWAHGVRASAIVALPLTVEGVVAGAVVLSSPEPCTVSPESLLLWQAMANHAGVALANARLLERVTRALRTKSDFLNTMSHELRSPLHVVIGYADMLREEGGDEARHLAGRIRGSALELLQLVENTMNAARLDARKVSLQVEAFSARDALHELAQGIAALPEAKRGVPVHWEVAPSVHMVRLDRLKLKEIVQNLVANALKFTPSGTVRVRVDQDPERLRIAVEDTGVGIAPDAQARVFEMFERVDGDDEPIVSGAGLGLYIVKSLVELMHGDIEVASQPGRGSCFTVHLPCRLDAAAAA